jgi:hypothetical protein
MRVARLGVVVVLVVTGAGACAETKLGLGEECLKDTDCLSGVCAAQACTDPGTSFTDASAAVAVTPGPEAGHDAGQDAGDVDSADGD